MWDLDLDKLRTTVEGKCKPDINILKVIAIYNETLGYLKSVGMLSEGCFIGRYDTAKKGNVSSMYFHAFNVSVQKWSKPGPDFLSAVTSLQDCHETVLTRRSHVNGEFYFDDAATNTQRYVTARLKEYINRGCPARVLYEAHFDKNSGLFHLFRHICEDKWHSCKSDGYATYVELETAVKELCK